MIATRSGRPVLTRRTTAGDVEANVYQSNAWQGWSTVWQGETVTDPHLAAIDETTMRLVGVATLPTPDELRVVGFTIVDPPAPPIVGACCDPDDGSCQVLTTAECTVQAGTYQGDGTDCSPNPCTLPTGACCIAGACTITTDAACAGDWLGNGAVCSPNPCPEPTGACCRPAVPQWTCSIRTATTCTTGGRVYQGDGTDCDPNPCPMATGACCTVSGTCTDTEQAACSGTSTWYGYGTDCDPNPCYVPGTNSRRRVVIVGAK
jgi:hypothetical protein